MPKAIESGRSAARSYTRVEGVSPEDARIAQQRAADAVAEAQAQQRELARVRAEQAAARQQTQEDVAYKAASQPYKKGGKVGSASKRADGCCVRGKTRGKLS